MSHFFGLFAMKMQFYIFCPLVCSSHQKRKSSAAVGKILFNIREFRLYNCYHVVNCDALMANPPIQTPAVQPNTVEESVILNSRGDLKVCKDTMLCRSEFEGNVYKITKKSS